MDLDKILKEGLDPLPHFPKKVLDSTTLLRAKDSESDRLLRNINANLVGFAKSLKKMTAEQKKHQIEKMEKMYEKAEEMAAEKVSIAGRLYDSIDSDIRVMDTTTKKLDVGVRRGLSSDDESEVSDGRRKKKKKKTEEPVPSSSLVNVEMPVDPWEPIYCNCRLVASGEMVCCDNENCKVEWFHFTCMGIKSPPPDDVKWFCEACRGDFKKVPHQWDYEKNCPPPEKPEKKKTKKVKQESD